MTHASNSNEWQTPKRDFRRWHELYAFDVDAAAARWNAQLPTYWTKAMDAFKQSSKGLRVFCNPPYTAGNMGRWMPHARSQVITGGAHLWGLHIPAHTAEGWWTENVMRGPEPEPLLTASLSLPGFANGYRRMYLRLAIDVWFYEGRRKHVQRNGEGDSARFPNAFVVFGVPKRMPEVRNHVRPAWNLAG